MASAQVMSSSAGSSRKQEHLEAGKRRLEEFRKKKAAVRKAVSASHSHPVPVSTVNEKQTSKNGQAQLINSVGAVADGGTNNSVETSGFADHDVKSHGFTHANDSCRVPIVVADDYSEIRNFASSHLLQMQPEQEGINHDISSLKSDTGFSYPEQTVNKVGMFETDTSDGNYGNGIPFAGHRVSKDNSCNYFRSFLNGVEAYDSNKDIISFEGPPHITTRSYAEGHATNLLHNDESDSANLTADAHVLDSESNNLVISCLEDRKPGNLADKSSSYQQKFELLSAGSNSDVSGSFNVPSYLSYPETYPSRSRPSFLDSLNISRESLVSVQSHSETEKFTPSSFPRSNFVTSSANLHHSTQFVPGEPLSTLTSPIPSADFVGNKLSGQKLIDDSLESRVDSACQKQNEDFSSLEQHIEDLTQEKFTLQCSLDTSKALAESLASENSSWTESYNQQASIVDQLKDEMEKLQGEIKARLVELESFKAEYMNAQLECNAADERAKLLASEVIGLEEKALRLRSNELKLERELENLSTEIASYKKKLSSLMKERQYLLQTIDALREENKLLQSKFRRASIGAGSADIDDRGHAEKDVSTSTNDLGLDSAGADRDNTEQVLSNALMHQDGDLLTLAHCKSVGFQDSRMSVPPDQVQIIRSIDSLISELMAEKEELVQALVTEVSTSTKLKDMNKELSQKLEIQTQRLELLTAQSMAHQIIPAKGPTGSPVVRESVAYADEGDEVVERVLGWIMKLFPGGPSNRRTSRL